MSKKRRNKKPVVKHNEKAAIGIHLNYIKALSEMLGCADAVSILTQHEKKEIYMNRMHFMQPKITDVCQINKRKIKFHTYFCQHFCKEKGSVFVDGHESVSVIALIAVQQFIKWLDFVPNERKNEITKAFQPLIEHFGKNEQPIRDLYVNYNRILLFSNLCTATMHSFKTAYEYRKKRVSGLYHTISIYSIEPRVGQVKLKGIKRTVYQLCFQYVNDKPNWLTISAIKLSHLYQGTEKEIPVYIQNHALKRFTSRTMPLGEQAAQASMESSFRMNEPMVYKNNVLFVMDYNKLKLGYFIGKPVGDILVITTFLFVTQHGTPEGDQLEKRSGLSKEEISYWNIAGLETFASNNMNFDQSIYTLFKDCGLDYLFEANKEIKIEESLNYNWEALNNYINMGKTELFDEGAKDEDFEEFLMGEPGVVVDEMESE